MADYYNRYGRAGYYDEPYYDRYGAYGDRYGSQGEPAGDRYGYYGEPPRYGADYYREPYGRREQRPGASQREPWWIRNGWYDRFGNYHTYSFTEPYGYYDSGSTGENYRGVGPRNYRRSDERIHEDVSDRLCDDPHIDASDITVAVHDGVVTLSGSIPTRRQKRLAEDTAESVSGVWDVNNQLRVTQQQGDRSTGGRSRQAVHPDMQVVGSGMNHVGQVKEVHDNDFVAARSMARDLCVPFSAVREVRGDQVILNVPADHVDDQNWPSPSLTGAGSS
ncbi:MAG TPA: BON domain-containing protein [Chloroflexota bacterium]|nr:BON domain-containing protein [Chloroflexota bacterium]